VSRSWSERVKRRFAPAVSAGVAVGRDYVGFAQLAANGGGGRLRTLTETKLDVPLFTGAPSAQAATTLINALKEFRKSFSARYAPVHVSLPDAAVRFTVFELRDLPKTPAAQLELVKFRLGREGGTAPGAVACQPLGSEGERHLLLGLSCDAGWRELVSDALAQAGIVGWSMSANVCRQFNRFHDRLTKTAGALVSIAPDAWSLCLWDADGRVRYVRAHWRTGGEDLAEVAIEVERSILGYVNSEPGRTVDRVYVVGGEETAAVAAALDARLREPCVRLSAEDGLKLEPTLKHDAHSAASSLAAALER